MKFKHGDVVKFYERIEPCVVYRVVDDVEQHLWFELLNKTCPHIRIECIGMAPVELLTPVEGHHKNMFALDKLLHLKHETN